MFKHILLYTFLLIFTFNGYSQKTKISFEKGEINLGTIKEEKGKVSFNLRFTNTGKLPLLIRKVKGSCGCTTPEWSKKPLLPGKKSLIKITIDPKNRKGTFDKSVTITSNTSPASHIIHIKGEIIPRPKSVIDYFPLDMNGLRFKKKHIPLMNIKSTLKINTITEYINTKKFPVKVERIDKNQHIRTKFSSEVVAPNKIGKLYIFFDAKKKNDWGFTIDTLKFSINGIYKPEYKIIVSSTIREDFSVLTTKEKGNAPKAGFSHTTYNFKTTSKNSTIKDNLVIENKGKTMLIIRKIISSCKDINIRYLKKRIKPGEKTDFSIIFATKNRLGLQNKYITFITNDPNKSIIKYKITGVIQNIKR